MNALIFAQLIGIRQSKKLFLPFLAAPLLLLFCSYHAAGSWMRPEYVLAVFAILNALLSSEITHCLTIDEIKDGLFDLILLSPLSNGKLLLGKLCIPFSLGAAVSFGSLLLNNLLSFWFPFVPWQFDPATSVLLLFSSAAGCLTELIILMVLRRKNTNLHFFVITGGMLFSLGMYALLQISVYWFVFSAGLMLLFLTLLALRCLKQKSRITFSKKRIRFQSLYTHAPATPLGGMVRNNLSVFRLHRHSLLHLAIAVLSPVVIAFFLRQTPDAACEAFLTIAMASIAASVNIYLIYYAFLSENRSGIHDILQAAGYSCAFRILEKTITAGALSSVLSAFSFWAIACIHGYVGGSIVLLTMLNCFLSAMMTSVFFSGVHTFKSETAAKTIISLLSVLLQIGGLFLAAAPAVRC